MEKAPDAYRTISEVADDLDIQQHVLRFWESRFSQIRPLKRGGGRRYYRPDDVELLKGIRHLLYKEGYTIKGVQRILKEHGIRAVQEVARGAPASDFGAPEPEPVEYIQTEIAAAPEMTAAIEEDEPVIIEAPAGEPAKPFDIAALQAVQLIPPSPVAPPPLAPAFTVTTPDPRERGQVAMFRGALQRGESGMGAGTSLEFSARMREGGAVRAAAAMRAMPAPDRLQDALDELLACKAAIETLRARR